ncbi:MAG: glycosyltransferase family 2 protein [Sphingomonadaceae bacterium]
MPLQIEILKPLKVRRGIMCLTAVYNEEWFLPHFLDHYRRLGVGHFIFFDDHSTDATRDILMKQPDCMVLTSAEKPPAEESRLRGLQMALSHAVPRRFAPGRWSLRVDADEFLILPRKFSNLPQLTHYLDHRGLACALAAMCDFYPESLDRRDYDPLPPFQGSPWFDRALGFQRIPNHVQIRKKPGGIRTRLRDRLYAEQPEVAKTIFDEEYGFARLWKVPLIKEGQGVVRADIHDVNVTTPLGIQLALAHFKFYPGLDKRIAAALESKAYFAGSREYRFLRAAIDHLPDEKLVGDDSIEFRSPRDMEMAGMIWAD